MVSRRALLARLPLVAAGGLGLWLVRDRIPWPRPELRFAAGRSTGWLPVAGQGGLIELAAEVKGRPVRMVVDSGAQFSAIDVGLAKALDLPAAAALPILAYGVSGRPRLTRTVKLDVTLPGLAISGLRAAKLDLARLSALTGRDFTLLLGRDALRTLVLEADMPGRRAALHAPEAYRPPPDARLSPLETPGGAPMLDVRVDGRQVRVMIDTGATGPLALSEAEARAAGLLAPGRDVRAQHSVSLGGLGLDRLAVAARVEIAGVALADQPVQIFQAGASAPLPAGLLGMGFLRRYRMGLDLPGRRLALSPPGLLLAPRPGGRTSELR